MSIARIFTMASWLKGQVQFPGKMGIASCDTALKSPVSINITDAKSRCELLAVNDDRFVSKGAASAIFTDQ
jgi:hypothetical protein